MKSLNYTIDLAFFFIEDDILHQVGTEEMNTECETAYIDIQTSKLYRIPCNGSSSCDVFCLNHGMMNNLLINKTF